VRKKTKTNQLLNKLLIIDALALISHVNPECWNNKRYLSPNDAGIRRAVLPADFLPPADCKTAGETPAPQ
jgi:hypothetical protein